MGVLCNNRVVLSNSNYKERPNFKTYFTTDSNAGGNAFALIQAKRRIRQMKFPSISGRHDVDSFNTNLQNSSYKVELQPFIFFLLFATCLVNVYFSVRFLFLSSTTIRSPHTG